VSHDPELIDVSKDQDLLARARAEQQEISVADADFLSWATPRADRYEMLRAGDLLLAFGALRGDANALSRFEVLCAQAAKSNPVERSPAFVDELRQTLLVDMLVGKQGRGPKLEGYRGRGRLAGWLAAVTLGTAVNLVAAHHKNGRAEPLDQESSLEVLIDWQTPELTQLRRQAGDAFRTAFHAAVVSLEPREQNVLKLRCVEGATDGAIAAFYGVTRASVVRWVSAIREKVLERTRAELAARVGAPLVDSLVRALQGELAVSLERFLHAAPS
jgi:RNA polymerase sigma-70 factor (ECF subfamily)